MDNYDYARAQRLAELTERQRVTDEAKEAGGWINLVPIWCPECGDIEQWPGHWSRPICSSCYLRVDESIRMRWVRAVTKPDDLEPAELPKMPPGLRPFEGRALRAMRSATKRAAETERTLIWQWLRRQARDEPDLDARALAELVKGGEHLKPRD